MSPGQRAAIKLQEMGFAHDCNPKILARVIDDETGALELLAVCKELEAHLRVETPETRGNPVAHAAEGRALRGRMNAAIAKAEGR